MTIRDPAAWALILDANPFPPGCSTNPSDWLAWSGTASFEQRQTLYAAVVVLLAERWADKVEAILAGAAAVDWLAVDLADVTMIALASVARELGRFAPSEWQTRCALAMLERTWTHGPAVVEALEVKYLEHLTIPGRAS